MEIPEPLPVNLGNESPPLATVPEAESPAVEETAGEFGFTDEEFQRRVTVVMAAIQDPEKRDRCLAEIHTYLSMFEQGMREMQQQMIAGGGPFAMFRKMFLGR